MKNEEDEAFDDLARKQGAWGGGFPAKRAMAADKFIAAEERKVGERYGYVPKLHPSEWMNAQPAQEPQKMIQMVDAAMVEMRNITPPLRRSECERLIRAALSNSPAAQPTDNPYGYDWSMLEAAQESLREHMARIKELEAQLAQPAQDVDYWIREATAARQAEMAMRRELEAQPVQEPQYEFLIDDLADWKQYVEADNAPYGLREHVTKVLLAHGIKEKNK